MFDKLKEKKKFNDAKKKIKSVLKNNGCVMCNNRKKFKFIKFYKNNELNVARVECKSCYTILDVSTRAHRYRLSNVKVTDMRKDINGNES